MPTTAPQQKSSHHGLGMPFAWICSMIVSVAKKAGGVSKIDQNMRLFMVPGMAHCNGGDGPNTFDALTALEQWVDQGRAPEKMTASHSTAGKVDRTRPLCSYPQTAVYSGSGDTNDAANFSCKVP